MMVPYLLLLLSLLAAPATLINAQSCPTPQVTCDPTLQSVAIPTPWYNLDFSVSLTAAQLSNSELTYLATDPSEGTGCYAHLGVVKLPGGNSGSDSNYIDIGNASSPQAYPGANGAANVLPSNIGGTSAGSVTAGTAGWTIEVTWKSNAQQTWAKVFNIGAAAGVSCFQFEWNSNSLQTQFTNYDASGTAGYSTVIPTTTFGASAQWNHGVIVQQQLTTPINQQAQSNWFVYLNGVLQLGGTPSYGTNPNTFWYSGAYTYLFQNVTRPQAYIGRSLWNDPEYNGLFDSFRVYNYALSQQQVQALSQAALGGCTITAGTAAPSNIAPNIVPGSSAVVAPTYSVTFSSDPNPTPGTPAGYTWQNSDQDDVQCGLDKVHQGMVSLQDGTQLSENDNIGVFTWVDLGTTAAPNAIAASASTPNGPMSQTLIGTTTGTTPGTMGFSLEVTFKPELGTIWSKVLDFGSTRNASQSGTCVNDVVFGWDNDNSQWQLEACDPNGNYWQIYDVGGIQPGTLGGFVSGNWYHAVIVFEQLGGASSNTSNWYVFVNNVLVSTLPNAYYPNNLARQNLWLGRSGWGDTLWSGLIDTFNYYPQALGVSQVNTLFNAAMGPTGAAACVYTAYTTPVVPPSSIFFSATFDTDPTKDSSGNAITRNYSWAQTTSNDASDVVQGVHSGILILNGCTPGNCGGNYVNLSAATGVNSIGQVLPPFGGIGTGSFDQGSLGWSFELTWKAYSQQNWAKLFDAGVGNGGGHWDVVFGWNSGNSYMSVDTTNLNNIGTNAQVQATPTINTGVWYHTVWVIQSGAGSTNAANFIVYTNGLNTFQLNGGIVNGNLNTYYPPLVIRSAANLGKSNWGDNYWVGELDTFRVYSIALNPNQVNTLYEAASNPGGVQTNFSCQGAGYDMTSVGNRDYSINYNGYNWLVHPCGYIDIGTCVPGANMCQGNTAVSYWEPSLNPILWQRIAGGVQMSVTDGAQCGGANFGRTSIIRFLCPGNGQGDRAPFLEQVNEVVTCTYVAIIITSAACQPPNPNLITAVGEPFASNQCGGGLYDLSALNLNDINLNAGAIQWYIRPCQSVANSNCSSVQPTSFCQAPTGAAYSVANYVGSVATPTVYTLTQQNGNYGLTMQLQDGTNCANQFPRVGIINFVCVSTATTPVLVSVVESPIIFCHYTAVINTNAVCGTPMAGNASGGPITTMAPTLSTAAVPNSNPTCYGAGFDVSASNIDMFYQQYGGYTFYVHPCGNFQNKQPCPAGTSMCQAANDGSGSAYVASRWNTNATLTQQWVQTPSGVQMTVATGDNCGSTAINRYAVYNFICDTAATTPQLSYVYELEECHYEAFISTAQACTYYQALLPSNANVGSNFYSNQCGGGVYPLSSLSSTELYLNGSTGTNTGFSYVVRPCGNVQAPLCSSLNPTSFCQYQGNTGYLPYNAATWSTTNNYNEWTVTPNGITLTIQDGSQCPVISNAERVGIFVFVCNAAATTPVLVSVQELEVCHYTATIQTSQVCAGKALIGTSVPFTPSSGGTGGNGGGGTTTGGGGGGSQSSGTNGGGGGGTVVTSNSSTSNSLSGGKLAAAIVVPIIGALLVACLCFIIGRAMGGGGKSAKMDSVSQRGNTSHQPHYDEPSHVQGEQSTNGNGVEMA